MNETIQTKKNLLVRVALRISHEIDAAELFSYDWLDWVNAAVTIEQAMGCEEL